MGPWIYYAVIDFRKWYRKNYHEFDQFTPRHVEIIYDRGYRDGFNRAVAECESSEQSDNEENE